MLKKIMNEVDTNGDGKIQYEGTSSIVPGARKAAVYTATASYSY